MLLSDCFVSLLDPGFLPFEYATKIQFLKAQLYFYQDNNR